MSTMYTDIIQQTCPYCGEPIELVIDCSVAEQSYIEDCQVCCRPISVSVWCGDAGVESIRLAHENE